MIAALDLEAARAGIERDFDELVLAGWFGAIVLAIILGLPVMSLVSVLAKQ